MMEIGIRQVRHGDEKVISEIDCFQHNGLTRTVGRVHGSGADPIDSLKNKVEILIWCASPPINFLKPVVLRDVRCPWRMIF